MKPFVRYSIVAAAIVLGVAAIYFAIGTRRKAKSDVIGTRVGAIRELVELSSLEVTADEVFRDTLYRSQLAAKAVVYHLRARVYIGFDLERLQLTERGDTLVVELPPETVSSYEDASESFRVLDTWILLFPNDGTDASLSTAEENLLKRNAQQRIRRRMYEQGYVRRARENALQTLTALFARFRDHVIVVDRYPNGQPDAPTPPPVELPAKR